LDKPLILKSVPKRERTPAPLVQASDPPLVSAVSA
jgi:hypothetical protein